MTVRRERSGSTLAQAQGRVAQEVVEQKKLRIGSGIAVTVIWPSVFPWFQVTVPHPVGEPGKSAKAMSSVVVTPSVPMVDWRTSWGAISYQAN